MTLAQIVAAFIAGMYVSGAFAVGIAAYAMTFDDPFDYGTGERGAISVFAGLIWPILTLYFAASVVSNP